MKLFGGIESIIIRLCCIMTFILMHDVFFMQDQQPEYNLFGTIVHSGFSPDSGHYYAYIKVFFGCFIASK